MPKTELTNMVMVQDAATGKIVVQKRIKSWCGLSLPGGHVEPDESFYDSAVREVREETGLEIENLHSCGVIHWLNTETHDRYIVFLYKTNDFRGSLMPASDEGENVWMTVEELMAAPSDNDIHRYIPMFTDGIYSEAFGPWTEGEPPEIIYQ